MRVGLTYDLRDEYLAAGYSEVETAEFDQPETIDAIADALRDAKIPEYAKVDEIPFDFKRRSMSVVGRTPEDKDRIISKGAPEAIFPRCANFELDGQLYPMDHAHIETLKGLGMQYPPPPPGLDSVVIE